MKKNERPKAAASALVSVDGGGHEDEVGAEEGADKREGDGRRLVYHHQLGLAQLCRVSCTTRARYILRFFVYFFAG